MKMIVRADDLGYSESVNYGILKTVRDGVINNVGMMSNMPKAKQGFQLLSGFGICLGVHANISGGKPLSDPLEIPSLVNGDYFKHSADYNQSNNDLVDVDEVVKEIQLQVNHFKEITGFPPRYIDFHAVMSKNFEKAVETVAKKNNIPFIGLGSIDAPFKLKDNLIRTSVAQGTSRDELYSEFQELVNKSDNDVLDLMIYHPGYIDAYLSTHSSLVDKRIFDADFLSSLKLKELASNKNIIFQRFDEI